MGTVGQGGDRHGGRRPWGNAFPGEAWQRVWPSLYGGRVFRRAKLKMSAVHSSLLKPHGDNMACPDLAAWQCEMLALWLRFVQESMSETQTLIVVPPIVLTADRFRCKLVEYTCGEMAL